MRAGRLLHRRFMRFLAFLRYVTGCAFLVGIVHAAALDGNKITADGTYSVTTYPGKFYVFSAAGTFGGGSLAVKWNDGTNATAFLESPATAAETWVFTAPSNRVDLILSGSSGASITVNFTLTEAKDFVTHSHGIADITFSGPFSDVYEAKSAGVPYLKPYLATGGSVVWRDYDSDAKIYASTVGLTTEQKAALSDHLLDIKGMGFGVKELLLGGSNWKARNGSTLRAVIGNDGTVTGTITEDVQGQIIPGTSGNYIKLANPWKSSSIAEFGMMAVASVQFPSAAVIGIWGGWDASNETGPQIFAGGTPAAGVIADQIAGDIWATKAGGWIHLRSAYAVNRGSTSLMPVALSSKAGVAPSYVIGAGRSALTNSVPATLYNDGPNWGFGMQPAATAGITGKMAYGLLTDKQFTPVQYAKLVNSGVKNGIFSVYFNGIALGMGDSMIYGLTGMPNGESEVLQQLTFYKTCGWNPNFASQNFGKPGSGIVSFEGEQATAIEGWMSADMFKRQVLFWGAHNDTGYMSSTQATREALCERYMAVLATYKARGAGIIVISPLESSSWTAPERAACALYRTYLESRCTALGFTYVNLHTDPDYSVAARNASLFYDTLHLSSAGYSRLADRIIAQVPNP